MTGAMTMLSIEPLLPMDADFGSFVEVLATEKLPIDGLGEPGGAFFRVTEAGQTAGFGGYEIHGKDALVAFASRTQHWFPERTR